MTECFLLAFNPMDNLWKNTPVQMSSFISVIQMAN